MSVRDNLVVPVAVMRSGRRVDLSKPQPSMIAVRDIAEHLAKLPMHRGGTWGFYSIAQHSTLVAAEIARDEGPLAALYGLLHHAHEAMLENATMADVLRLRPVLHRAFDLDFPVPDCIYRALMAAHLRVEMTEFRQLCAGRETDVAAMERNGTRPLRGMIRPLGWDRALDRFLDAVRVYAVGAALPSLPVFGDLL